MEKILLGFVAGVVCTLFAAVWLSRWAMRVLETLEPEPVPVDDDQPHEYVNLGWRFYGGYGRMDGEGNTYSVGGAEVFEDPDPRPICWKCGGEVYEIRPGKWQCSECE